MNNFFNDYDQDNNTTSNTFQNNSSSNNNGRYAEEIFSKKIETRNRTYYIDVKQSVYGKFLKIVEKRKGKKNIIMIDSENVDEVLAGIQEAKDVIQD